MSIKIYYAYRIPLGKLDRFLDLTRERLFSSAVHQINGWMKLVDDMKAGLGEDATAVDMIAEMEEKLKKTWEETESMSVQTLSGFSFSR